MSTRNYQILLLLFILIAVIFVSGNKIHEGYYTRQFNYAEQKNKMDQYETLLFNKEQNGTKSKYGEIMDLIVEIQRDILDHNVCFSTEGHSDFKGVVGESATSYQNTEYKTRTGQTCTEYKTAPASCPAYNTASSANFNKPTACSEFDMTSTGISQPCYAAIWEQTGCTTPPSVIADQEWPRTQTLKRLMYDVYDWSTMTDTEHRRGCYGPISCDTIDNRKTTITSKIVELTKKIEAFKTSLENDYVQISDLDLAGILGSETLNVKYTGWRTDKTKSNALRVAVLSELSKKSTQVKELRVDLDNKLAELNQVANSKAAVNKMTMDSTIYASLLWTVLATTLIAYLVSQGTVGSLNK